MNDKSARSGCVPTAELLPELALGILGGTERADVLAHLDRCAACRDESAAWAATVDALPTVLADQEPPSGFEARTLERLRADRDRVPRRSTVQRVLMLAAVVAAVIIASVAAIRIIDARSDTSSSTALASARMVGNGGKHAGNAFMTSGSEHYVFVDVDYGVKTGMYRVESVDSSDRVTALGMVAVTAGHGAWAGELPGRATVGTPRMVRLVEPSGEVLCVAKFGRAAA
jgi:anti-sigma-K factor RskA